MNLTLAQQAIVNDSSVSKSERFRRLYETGLSPYQIAKAMNTYDSFVRSALSRTHIIPTKKGPTKADLFREDYDNGLAVSEIARKHNSNYSHVYQVIAAYRDQKARAERNAERPDTYLCLDGHVVNLMRLPEQHRAYLDGCIDGFRLPLAAQEFHQFIFGRENPVLAAPVEPDRPFGVVTSDAFNTPLFQVLRDMLLRLEIKEHTVVPSDGALSNTDPLTDEWVTPTEAAIKLAVSLPAVHKAIETGRLIARVAKEGGTHRVISMNSIRALQLNIVASQA